MEFQKLLNPYRLSYPNQTYKIN